MKTVILFLMVCTLPLSLRADLIVYRETERARVTGSGREVTVPVSTYIVHDLATRTFSAIGFFQIGPNKLYAITNASHSHTFTHGINGQGRSFSVMSRAMGSKEDPEIIMSAYFAKGRNTTLNLGARTTDSFPRSLNAVTRSLRLLNGVAATYESNSTVVFQSTRTKAANTAADTAEIAIERLRIYLEGRGYKPAS